MKFQARKIVAATVSALFIASSTAPAFAAPIALPITGTPGFFGTSWTATNDGGTSTGGAFTGTCDSSPGFTIQDATGPDGSGDAYDNGYQVFVNGAVVVAPGGIVDLTGTTVTVGPVVMSGLNVTTQYYFSPSSAVMRVLVTLQNPTAAPIAATVQVPVNFGSDGGTVINATSSGDLAVTAADRWAITTDGGPGDAVNLTVVGGPGAVAVPVASIAGAVFDCAATNGGGMTYNLNVPASGSQSVMLFAGVGGVTANDNTVASALAAAALFNSNSTLRADWLSGLTPSQLAQVVNWAFGPASVPTLSQWAMAVLAAMMGALAFLGLRRRRGSGIA